MVKKQKKKFQVTLVGVIEVGVTYYGIEAFTEEKAKEIAFKRFKDTYEVSFGKDEKLHPGELAYCLQDENPDSTVEIEEE